MKFTTPEMEITRFESSDIITTSTFGCNIVTVDPNVNCKGYGVCRRDGNSCSIDNFNLG